MTHESEETTLPNNPPEQTTPPKKKKSWLLPLGLLIVLAVIVGVALFNQGMFGNNSVATVNGEKISREEFNDRLEQAKGVYSAQGADISDEATLAELEQAVLDEMINQTLLYNTAQDAGVSATQEKVDEEYKNIVDQVGGEEALNTELETQGLTETELRDNIEQGIVIRKYIEQEMGDDAENVSEEELNELYEQYKSFQEQSEQEPKPLEEVREDLTANIKQQKMQEFATNLIEELRASSEIETNLEE